ncbi:hypothetical protein GCM10020000_02120 [Streptomyces olivoverticillatus]
MAAGQGGGRPARSFTVFRFFFAATAVAAVVLGCIGFRAYVRTRPEFGSDPFDLLYYSLQLFVLSSAPLDKGGPLPAALEIARYAAPLATAYAVAETVRVLGADEIRRVRVARRRGHAVVCGSGQPALLLAERLRAAGTAVVVVAAARQDGDTFLSVAGDARRPAVLRAAGAHRASVLYACEDGSGDNVLIASAAQQLARRPGEPLRVYASVDDPDLCSALRARHLAGGGRSGIRLDFFNVDEAAARLLAERERIEGNDPARPPCVLIVGQTPFARSLLAELARRWRLLGPSAAKLPVILVGPTAASVVEVLVRRYEFLPEVCHFTSRDVPDAELDVNALLAPAASGGPLPRPDRVYICRDADDLSLTTALTAVRLWNGPPGSLTVRLAQQGPFGRALGHDDGDLLDDLGGRLRVFGVTDAACTPELIGDDLVEQLARAFHDAYVLARSGRGDCLHTNAAMVPWEQLPDTLRRANRAAAAHVGAKLRAIGCALAPRADAAVAFALRDDEVETLAKMEHLRWMEERTADGWVHGPARDDAARIHPDLQSWERLPETVREKDRDAVRDVPGILASAGFQVIRLVQSGR